MQNFQQGQPPAAAPAQPMAQPAAQGSMAGQDKDYTAFIRELHDLLLLRIEAAGQKNPNYGMAIDTGISPEAAQELFVILPEMKPIFDAIESASGGGQQPITAPQQMAGMQQEQNPILRDTPAGVSKGLMG